MTHLQVFLQQLITGS